MSNETGKRKAWVTEASTKMLDQLRIGPIWIVPAQLRLARRLERLGLLTITDERKVVPPGWHPKW